MSVAGAELKGTNQTETIPYSRAYVLKGRKHSINNCKCHQESKRDDIGVYPSQRVAILHSFTHHSFMHPQFLAQSLN
jgi:hypothetical protein